MTHPLQDRILSHVRGKQYKPVAEQRLAEELHLSQSNDIHAFRDALKELMRNGRLAQGDGGSIMLPSQHLGDNVVMGAFRKNIRGFGFVVPSDPADHADLYIGETDNGGALTGDIVRAQIINRSQRDGKTMFRGKIIEIVTRTQKRFVGTLTKRANIWLVLPDGNVLTEAILTPDAAARHVRPGTKVVVELTAYPQEGEPPQGVITEILGETGEKDVDLKATIIQFNLPGPFPQECLDQAREAVDKFNATKTWPDRQDLSDRIICTIDPDDAKDYDDAISLQSMPNGNWELGVHIADVSHFIPTGSPLDIEARKRGNSCYFPGHVIPMLPEILSNGVCSLQEAVPRLCKTAFITLDDEGNPLRARMANTVIRSASRLRYREAQAIIDRAPQVPHPDGPRPVSAYPPAVVELLDNMNRLAKKIQKRRLAAGQLVLNLPTIDLVLDEDGKVVGAKPEDESFTHTLIEMFMVEANEAAARLLDSRKLPFLRRTHPEPDLQDSSRLREFVEVAGHRLPKDMDRKSLQKLLAAVKGRPESFAINLAVLKSLTRAEYSPKPIGHYALASHQYCHFTSPIRRYADLTVHRLLDNCITGAQRHPVPTFADLIELGKNISFTERNAESAEHELRKVKVLSLLEKQVGNDFAGVITGIANFGIFIQLTDWLVDGLVRYEELMDDWWDVDERRGIVLGKRTGTRIGIGDTATVRIASVDIARRELKLAIMKINSRARRMDVSAAPSERSPRPQKNQKRSGKPPLNRKSKPPKGRGGRRR